MYEIFESLMKKRGLKYAQISRDTGISYSTFTDWKAGRACPKYDKLKKLAEYFGVSVEYLMGEKEKDGYYLNPETARVAQEIFENDELQALVNVAIKSDPESVQMATDMLKRLNAYAEKIGRLKK